MVMMMIMILKWCDVKFSLHTRNFSDVTNLSISGRRQKKKVLMAVIPLLFGMKSAAVVIFAMAIVTVLTLKAFVASKAALLVTVGMAVKKLYENYSSGWVLLNLDTYIV
jgi:hypothetical protein